MTAALTTLIQSVETADSSPGLIVAVQNLAAANQVEAIPTLISALSYNNPGAAVAAVNGLVQLGGVAVPALLELLDLHNYTARSWAIRALACIGDPRGLTTLLTVTATDFSPSVRRAAVRGLGLIVWQWFPAEVLPLAWTETLTTLLFVAHQDEEWVVRYAAIASLQDLGIAMQAAGDWVGYQKIVSQLSTLAEQETSLGVQGRVWLAQQQLQQKSPTASISQPCPLAQSEWQKILSALQLRQTLTESQLSASQTAN